MSQRDIERLRALEKEIRDEADADIAESCNQELAEWVRDKALARGSAKRGCATRIATLIAELGQEVGAVAWPSERVSIADPHDPGYRIVGFKISESHPWHGKYGLSEPLNALDRAISNSPAHTSEARDVMAARIVAKYRREPGWGCMNAEAQMEKARGFVDAAMRQEGGNG